MSYTNYCTIVCGVQICLLCLSLILEQGLHFCCQRHLVGSTNGTGEATQTCLWFSVFSFLCASPSLCFILEWQLFLTFVKLVSLHSPRPHYSSGQQQSLCRCLQPSLRGLFRILSYTNAASSCGPGLWVAVTTSVMLLCSLLSFQLPR